MSSAIPVGMEYASTATGVAKKVVTCCQCRHGYSFQLERSADGSGFRRLFLNRAGAQARAKSAGRPIFGGYCDKRGTRCPAPCAAPISPTWCHWSERSIVLN
jgi:hypothetical protein